MKVRGNKYLRVVYSICLGKEVYIGLSFDPWRRFRQHVERGTAPVKKLIANGGELHVLTPLLPLEAAIVKETEEIQTARNAGFQVLNQTQGGETGGCWKIWTVESIRDEAKKHQTRKAFAVYGRGAYSAARRHGILDDVCKHMPTHHMLAQRRYLQSRIAKSQGWTEDSDDYAADLIAKNRPPKGDKRLLTHAPAIDKTRGT
jgi:predicted GIY-YIG superfamily endonuclease